MRALRQSVVRAWAEATEGVRIALSALVGARLRSFLTTLGIVIGVMTVIAIVAIIQGLNASFETQMANLGANTVYVSKWKWFSTNDDWWEYRNRKNVGTAELRAVEEEALSAVSVSPMANQLGTLVSYLNHSVENVRTIGTSPRYLDTNGGNVFAGRFLSDPDVQLSRNSAVLGAEVAQRLFEGVRPEEILGRHVLVNGVRFTVVGTMARRGRMLGMDMDVNVLVPYTTLLRDFGSKRSIIIAVAAEPGKMAQLEDELTGILRRVRQVPPEKKDDFTINRQDQILKLYGQLTGALYGVAIGVGLITLVVGGIGIMNIMLVSVTERTREIGVRMAVGARRRRILAQFLAESVALSAIGGILGVLAGAALAVLAREVFQVPASIPAWAVILSLATSSGAGLLFGIYPAARASKLDPVEAMRTE